MPGAFPVVASAFILILVAVEWLAGEAYRPLSPGESHLFRSYLLSQDGKEVVLSTSGGMFAEVVFLDTAHGWAGGDEVFFFDHLNDRWRIPKGGSCPHREHLAAIEGNENGDAFAVMASHFVNKDVGWMSFENGLLVKTTDGGRTWCDLASARKMVNARFFSRLHFTDVQRGLALTAEGLLYATNNGGAEWEPIVANEYPSARFDDVFILNPKAGWAVSTSGLFLIAD
jgi:hypothetical protein